MWLLMNKMIKKIRFKFIFSSMVALLIVLGSIIFGMNYSNYGHVNKFAEVFINDLEKSDGQLPVNNEIKDINIKDKIFMDIRYISVYVDNENNILSYEQLSYFSRSSVTELVTRLDNNQGIIDNYSYKKINTSKGDMIVFVDVTRELEQYNTFLTNSLKFSFLGLLSVFILVLVLSKNIMKPIKESYQKQKEFITNASHELKTPLTIISANNELLEMDYGKNDSIDEISNQVKKLTILTNDLVTLSRMDEVNKGELMRIDFPISDIVLETATPFIALAETKNLKLELDIEKNLSFHGDEKYIKQLISILLDNAVKYANNDLPIKISMKKEKKINIIVSNSCDNISKGKQNVLFDRFYQAEESRNSTISSGYGIGLSLAKAIVENNNGSINAYSKDGKSLSIEINF
jgi:signal transduction histidine kinase